MAHTPLQQAGLQSSDALDGLTSLRELHVVAVPDPGFCVGDEEGEAPFYYSLFSPLGWPAEAASWRRCLWVPGFNLPLQEGGGEAMVAAVSGEVPHVVANQEAGLGSEVGPGYDP